MSRAISIVRFRNKILNFYKVNGRDLPWRHTIDAYKVWVSEIMLQQTQVDRVVDYYNRWLKKWPTVHKLARAKRSDVLKMWMGLGYNNRAVNMHKAAQVIVDEFNGDTLEAMKNYERVPGVGPYISRAVRIFAANEDLFAVETNIRRIYMHEFNLKSDKKVESLAEQCLPTGKSREWHNALMDYGALILTSRKTGIKPKTVQGKFEGSDRQIRARVLRYMLKVKRASFSELKQFSDDQKRLKSILRGMVKDDLLSYKGKYLLNS